jgi:hypothetical protein
MVWCSLPERFSGFCVECVDMSVVSRVGLGLSLLGASAVASAAPLITDLDFGDVIADVTTVALAIVGVLVVIMGARLVFRMLR